MIAITSGFITFVCSEAEMHFPGKLDKRVAHTFLLVGIMCSISQFRSDLIIKKSALVHFHDSE